MADSDVVFIYYYYYIYIFFLTALTARDALLIVIKKKIVCRQMFVFRVADHRISRTAFLSSLCMHSPLYDRV